MPTCERKMPKKDAPDLQGRQRLAYQYFRRGYRRVQIFLRREGFAMSCGRRRIGQGAWRSILPAAFGPRA